jgi:hypothetical protein
VPDDKRVDQSPSDKKILQQGQDSLQQGQESLQQGQEIQDGEIMAKEAKTKGFTFMPLLSSSEKKRAKANNNREQILRRNVERKSELKEEVERQREREAAAPEKAGARPVPKFLRQTSKVLGVGPSKPQETHNH